jgi:alpha-soluble NSF attachment protein
MSTKKNGPPPQRPPPPQLSETSRSIFDNREQLNERGEKLSNLVRLTEAPDPTKDHPEPPEELFSKAEGLLSTNKSSVRRFLSSLTDKKPNQNTEKAAEMFTAAATKWKIGQNFPDAAKSFEKAAECYVISENPFGQVQNLSQSAQCWRQVPDLKEGLRVCEKCSELYLDLNKPVRAAKEIQSMADAFKRLYSTSKNTDHSNQAIELYHKAAKFYLQDGKSRAACSRIKIEVATLMVVPQHQILEGGKIFEAEALIACNEKLLKYGAKTHFFRAGLCKLHQSGDIAHDAFNRYCEEFPSFFETREAILLAELITSVKNKNFGDWTKAIEKHELCTRLDPWTKEVVGLIQALHFTSEDELNFDLEEFLDFNKVPGLDDSSSEPETQTGDEPDLT